MARILLELSLQRANWSGSENARYLLRIVNNSCIVNNLHCAELNVHLMRQRVIDVFKLYKYFNRRVLI